jgi:hypothetical protein
MLQKKQAHNWSAPHGKFKPANVEIGKFVP